MTTMLLIAAGAVLLLWPNRGNPFPGALSVVRLRLLRSEGLGDGERKAIDALTLALVSGSDME